MPKKLRHIGWRVERCRYSLLERVFAEEWIKECTPRPGINYGFGLLQDLFVRPSKLFGLFRAGSLRLLISKRDAFVAATVVQWLGTNCGYAFLEKCLRRAGLKIVAVDEKKRVRDSYYSQTHQDGMYLHPGAWHNLARHEAYFDKAPPVVDKPIPFRVIRPREERRAELLFVIRDRRRKEELKQFARL